MHACCMCYLMCIVCMCNTNCYFTDLFVVCIIVICMVLQPATTTCKQATTDLKERIWLPYALAVKTKNHTSTFLVDLIVSVSTLITSCMSLIRLDVNASSLCVHHHGLVGSFGFGWQLRQLWVWLAALGLVGSLGSFGFGWQLWQLWVWLAALGLVGSFGSFGFGWQLWVLVGSFAFGCKGEFDPFAL